MDKSKYRFFVFSISSIDYANKKLKLSSVCRSQIDWVDVDDFISSHHDREDAYAILTMKRGETYKSLADAELYYVSLPLPDFKFKFVDAEGEKGSK